MFPRGKHARREVTSTSGVEACPNDYAPEGCTPREHASTAYGLSPRHPQTLRPESGAFRHARGRSENVRLPCTDRPSMQQGFFFGLVQPRRHPMCTALVPHGSTVGPRTLPSPEGKRACRTHAGVRTHTHLKKNCNLRARFEIGGEALAVISHQFRNRPKYLNQPPVLLRRKARCVPRRRRRRRGGRSPCGVQQGNQLYVQ